MGNYMPEPNLDPPEGKFYHCPECGEELNADDPVYRDGTGNILGCRFCIEVKDAEDCDLERY